MHTCDCPLPDRLDLSRARRSELGLYHVQLAHDPPCRSGDAAPRIGLHITASGLPVDRAELEVTGGMPQRGLRLPGAPVVRPAGGGHYWIEDLLLSPPGWWLLRLTITAAAGIDAVTFNLVS